MKRRTHLGNATTPVCGRKSPYVITAAHLQRGTPLRVDCKHCLRLMERGRL